MNNDIVEDINMTIGSDTEDINFDFDKDMEITSYNDLSDKPKINSVTLIGDKSSSDLGLQPAGNYLEEESDPVFTASASYGITSEDITNWDNKSDFSGSYNDLTDKPEIPDVSSFITKNVDNLTYYTKTSDLSAVATSGSYTDLSNKPTIPDVSNFITKDVNNLTNYTIKTNTGSYIDLSINTTTYVVTLDLKDIDGNVISTDSFDLPLESVVVNGHYDNNTKKVVLTLENGSTVDFSVADLVAGLQTEITSTNKLSSDYVDDTNSGNKFVTTSEKNAWNNKSDFSGNYNDLTNKPTIPDVSNFITKDVSNLTYYTLSTNLSSVATSGSYNDLSNKPTIPSKLSDLTNDNNTVTDANYVHTDNNYTTAEKTKLAGLENYDDTEVNKKIEQNALMYNALPELTGTGTELTLNNTAECKMAIELEPSELSQDDTPTPSDPQDVHVITGNNTIKIENKNLLNLTNLQQGTSGTTTSNKKINSITVNGTSAWGNTYFYIENTNPNTSYTVSATFLSSLARKTGITILGANTTSETPTLINSVNIDIVSNVPQQAVNTFNSGNYKYFLIRFWNNSTNSALSSNVELNIYNIQLEKGTSASIYTLHQEQTLTITLGDLEYCRIGNYSDKFFKNTIDSEDYDSTLELNKWYLKKNIGKYQCLGTENWLVYNNVELYHHNLFDKGLASSNIINGYCNYCETNNANYVSYTNQRNGLVFSNITTNWGLSEVSKSAWNTYLQTLINNGKPLMIYYPLETPIYIPLNDTLQVELDNIYEWAKSYQEQTNISQTNTDLPFVIKYNGIINTASKTELANYVQTSQLLNAIYPIGSIYMSVNSTSPATLFGGTWEAIGQGRTLVGVGDNGTTNYNTVEATGGSESENYTPAGTNAGTALTANQLPAITGTITLRSTHGSSTAWGSGVFSASSGTNSFSNIAVDNTTGTSSIVTMSFGNNQTHTHTFTGTQATINHIQPYLVVYMWKRTA